jgi:hypothetical protein
MLHVQRILPGGPDADVAGIAKRVITAMTQLATAAPTAPAAKPASHAASKRAR